jgi:alkylhydroperoxidase family enzyme
MESEEDRVHRVEVRETVGETRRIFETYQQERGNVPNMFRTMAHRPELLRTMIAHFRAVMSPGTVSVRTKELVSLVVSGINGCEY